VKGVIKVTREERNTSTYTIHNADSTPRQVILEHAIREEWRLAQDLKPEESGTTHYRFRLAAGPGKTEKIVVKESRPSETDIYVSTITDSQVAAFVERRCGG
jgi:hypothetical protein